MWLLYYLAAFYVLAMLIRPLCFVLMDHVIYRDGGDQRLYEEFMDDARQRGLSYRQSMDELQAREAIVKIRRLASDAVTVDPASWYATLQETKKSVVSDLALDRPDIARAVASTLDDLNYADILYLDAVRAIDNIRPAEAVNRVFTMDQRAALRILR